MLNKSEAAFFRLSQTIDLLNRQTTVLERPWLTKSELDDTEASYNREASFYNSIYELSRTMGARTAHDYLISLFDKVRNLEESPKCFVLGSGNGRDCMKLVLAGIDVYAVDYSAEMMKKILWKFNGEQINSKFNSIFADILLLPDNFVFEYFDLILGDSCFQHLNHPTIFTFLAKAYHWLKPGGVILFRLKQTEHGMAYVIHDGVGTRYYTSWTPAEIEELKKFLIKLGYKISQDPADDKVVPHKDALAGTPAFRQLVISKA